MNSNLHFGGKIKRLVEEKDGSVNAAAERLGYTVQALYAIFEKVDVNTSLLKKLSKAYSIPIAYLFDIDNSTDENWLTVDNKGFHQPAMKAETELRIAVLESEKNGLEEQIKLLREMVDVLKTRDK